MRFRTLYSPLIAVAATVAILAVLGSASAAEKPTAEEMMLRAHQARAVWRDFPGFTAKIAVRQDDSVVQGRVTVTADGEVKLDVPEAPQTGWAKGKLKSLVAHRAPTDGREYNVAFAKEKPVHPLGRKIRFKNDRLHSVYRIEENVIREVHRTMGKMRFAISVMRVKWNPEEKYLPAIYTVNYWDTESGDLTRAETTRDQWKRVGDFDLPRRILTVTAGDDDRRTVRSIRLTKHRLLEAKTAAGSK